MRFLSVCVLMEDYFYIDVYSWSMCIRHSILILKSAAIHVCYSNSYFSSKSQRPDCLRPGLSGALGSTRFGRCGAELETSQEIDRKMTKFFQRLFPFFFYLSAEFVVSFVCALHWTCVRGWRVPPRKVVFFCVAQMQLHANSLWSCVLWCSHLLLYNL